MFKIAVNIMPNKSGKKPNSKEVRTIQNNICKAENVKSLEFNQFINLVGNKGYSFKSSYLVGGSSNNDFAAAFMLVLDFDDGTRIENFLSKTKSIGLDPTAIYKSFSCDTIPRSHTVLKDSKKEAKKNKIHIKDIFWNKARNYKKVIPGTIRYKVIYHKFRAIWKLNKPIEDPKVKTTLQLMLMEVFPNCDKMCKDLSRLYYGGKEVVYYNEAANLVIRNLIMATLNKYGESKNGKRERQRLCKRLGLNMIEDNFPAILKENSKWWEKCNILNNNIIEDVAEIPPNYVLYDGYIFSFIDTYKQDRSNPEIIKDYDANTEIKEIVRFDFERLREICPLFNDFVTGSEDNEHLYHDEIFRLITNLYMVRGFGNILKKYLEEYNYFDPRNKYNTYKSMSRYKYTPMRCSGGKIDCKYSEECKCINILSKYYEKQANIKIIESLPTKTLEESERELKEVFDNIPNMQDNEVLLVKAPTGIGKSKQLESLDLTHTVIAVSNHRLAEQLYSDLTSEGRNKGLVYYKALITDNMPIELQQQIQKYYDLGLYGEVKNLLYDELSNFNRNPDPNKIKYMNDIKTYVDILGEVEEADSLLFTHHRAAYHNTNDKIDTIIIDEDLLGGFIETNNFKCGQVLSDIDNILEWIEVQKKWMIIDFMDTDLYNNYTNLEEKLGKLKSFMYVNHKSTKFIENFLQEIYSNKDLKNILVKYIKSNPNKVHFALFKLINAEYIKLEITDKDRLLYYVNGKTLKQLNKYNKVIILSATLDNVIHPRFINKYCCNKIINFIDLGNTELKGKLYCDCSYSFSRTTLKNLTDKQKNKIMEIFNKNSPTNVITFMRDDIINVSDFGKQKITYFGMTEGLNGYQGQDLIVIGTPHTQATLYESYGVLLTGGCPVSSNWKSRRVRKYGYEFTLNTYEEIEDELYTEIQMYFLYSELIQAVGRARLLRYDCNVYVYSSLPLPQCNLI